MVGGLPKVGPVVNFKAIGTELPVKVGYPSYLQNSPPDAQHVLHRGNSCSQSQELLYISL